MHSATATAGRALSGGWCRGGGAVRVAGNPDASDGGLGAGRAYRTARPSPTPRLCLPGLGQRVRTRPSPTRALVWETSGRLGLTVTTSSLRTSCDHSPAAGWTLARPGQCGSRCVARGVSELVLRSGPGRERWLSDEGSATRLATGLRCVLAASAGAGSPGLGRGREPAQEERARTCRPGGNDLHPTSAEAVA
jgi:hypothetical protein